MEQAERARTELLTFIKHTRPDPQHDEDPYATTYEVTKLAEVLSDALEKVARGEILYLLVSAPPQHGKQCSHDTPVLTTAGWKNHGDLKVGDYVYGSDGKPVQVVALSEESLGDVEVEFVDGEIIHCHENHEWTVHKNDERRRPLLTLESKSMLATGAWIGERGKRGGRARYSVDWVAVQGEEKDLPIDPYCLGAWLGDGSSGNARITHAQTDMEVVVEIANHYFISAVTQHKTTGAYTTSFNGQRANNKRKRGGMSIDLENAGVIDNKHIPEAYFTASIDQRLRLLAGLIDTDGSVHHRSRRATFSNTNKRLIEDVAILVRSLGMRTTISETAPCVSSSGIVGKLPVFQVTFSPPMAIPCKIKRKRIDGFDVKYRTRGIVDIRKVAPKPGRCIQVAAEDGIYLVGRGLVPTHNSEVLTRRFLPWYTGKFPHRHVMFGTYSQDLANVVGDEVRNIINSPEYNQVFPEHHLRAGSKSKEYMVTDKGGKLSLIGRGGAGTGKPADLWCIDDPIKDDAEAQSATIREATWQWFTKVVFTRCHALSSVIIVMTRWSDDDLIGRLTDKSNPHYKESIAKKFTYINIPAIIDTAPMAKALQCKVGDSLWPERFPVTHLETARDLNPLGFNAMYMGRPTPPEGAFFKRDQFRGYEPHQLPKSLRHYLSGDLAISPERDRDKSCVGHWGLDADDTLWLLPDLYWEQKAADNVVEDLVQYGKDFPIFTFFGEKGQIQKSIGPFLEKRMREEGVHFNIELFPTTGNKGARAVSFRGRMAQGKVRFPTFAPWWPKFFEVMLKFTGSGEDREDDPADMCGLIGQGLGMQVRASGPSKQGNVIIPGTLAWVKQAAKAERDIEERKKRLRGM
jgi:predicted phage terminase large subunit-like protein